MKYTPRRTVEAIWRPELDEYVVELECGHSTVIDGAFLSHHLHCPTCRQEEERDR